MKKNVFKQIIILMAIGIMTISMAACGAKTHNLTVTMSNEQIGGQQVDAMASVYDKDGNMIAGAVLTTDEDSKAVFELEDGEYTVKLEDMSVEGLEQAEDQVTMDGEDTLSMFMLYEAQK